MISNGGSTITMTDGGNSEQTSWFISTPQSITSFTASFDYQATANGTQQLADGVAFVLQKSGPSALGNDGSGLGYAGISGASAAVEFNVLNGPDYNSQEFAAGHVPGTNFATDGMTGTSSTYISTGDVDLANPTDTHASGDEIQVVLTYDGSVLTETLTDLDNGATFMTSYTENLTAILGGETAYVGFTTGTGGAASTQTISNFNFEAGSLVDPTVPPGTSNVVGNVAFADSNPPTHSMRPRRPRAPTPSALSLSIR